ncbi:thioredoxin family protein [Spirochaeta cellobiosiphila]|uniref:thioredoxin family protein n=1 Tax=Spirochaeta cellobiosiphila TaxID=504483 RepID=UPI000A0236EA|nr:thioredoxin family protein [Spirochaeta cellobiosiphila]
MKTLNTLEDLNTIIQKSTFLFLYISNEDCGVCKTLKPKIINMLQKYENIDIYYVDTDIAPEIAAQLSVFTIPGMLFYIDQKEMIREARYVSIEELDSRINRLYSLRSEARPHTPFL